MDQMRVKWEHLFETDNQLHEIDFSPKPSSKAEAKVIALEKLGFKALDWLLKEQIREPFSYSMQASKPWDSEGLIKVSKSGKLLVTVALFFKKSTFMVHQSGQGIEAKNLGRFLRKVMGEAEWKESKR